MSDATEPIRNSPKIPFPAWTIVDEKKHALVGLPTSAAIINVPSGFPSKAAPAIFSAHEVASAFINNSGAELAGQVPLKFEGASQFRDFLTAARNAGAKHVGFDLSFEHGLQFGEWIDIDIVLARLDEEILHSN